MKKIAFIGWIVLLNSSIIFAQEKKDTLENIHSPKKAAKLSIIFPGAGQVYNHRAMPKGKKNAWWKLPIIYAGLGATGYLLVTNHILQRDLKNEFIFRSENGYPNPDFPEFHTYDQQGVLQLHQQHKGTRDMMLFAFIGVYGLNVLDALVEAHFVDFDVSEDLSLSIRPTMHDFQSPGIRFSFNFR